MSAPGSNIAALQTQICLAGLAADRRVFRRSFPRDRHGRGDRAADVRAHRKNSARSQIAYAVRDHGARSASWRRRTHATICWRRNSRIGDTLLLIGPWKEIERYRADTKDLAIIRLPVEIDQRLPAPGKVAAGSDLSRVRYCVDGQRHRAERAGGPDRMPSDGRARLCRLRQRLSIDRLENDRLDRWHVAIFHALERTGGVELAAEGLKSSD